MMKNKAAVHLAHLRAKKLSPERRKEIAKMGGEKSAQLRREKAAEALSTAEDLQ